MDRKLTCWVLLSIAGALSCATIAFKRNLVAQRAAFDLGCDQSIDIVELGNGNVFGATGCGRRASYVVNCRNGEGTSCTAIMNSDEHEVAQQMPASSAGTPEVAHRHRTSADGMALSDSAPPDGAGGVLFGQSAESIGAACEATGYRWKRAEDVAACSGLLESVGYGGMTRIKMCNGVACEIRLGLDLASSEDGEAYLGEFAKLHESLIRVYGEPGVKTNRMSSNCGRELLGCLKSGDAKLRSVWHWKAGVHLELQMVEQEGC